MGRGLPERSFSTSCSTWTNSTRTSGNDFSTWSRTPAMTASIVRARRDRDLSPLGLGNADRNDDGTYLALG